MRTAVVAALAVLAPFPGNAAGPPVEAEFAKICADIRNSHDPYYGELTLRDALAQMEKPGPGDRQAERLRVSAAFQLIKLGKPVDALRHLDSLLEDSAPATVNPEFRKRVLGIKAIAHLQAAEDINCIDNHTADSCLLPIGPAGVHSRPEHARKAAEASRQLVELQMPEPRPRAVWLLNLSKMISGDFPDGIPERLRMPAKALSNDTDFKRWRDIAPELGINAVDLAGGAIMDDFDGDGLLDLISSTASPCDGLKAFRNNGKGGFENVARDWRLDAQLGGLNLVHADYDNDGDLDLLILRGGWLHENGKMRNSLLRNDLHKLGRFTDVTRSAGIAKPALPTQTGAWADYDGDGDLDLYVGNEGAGDWQAYPSQLFRNNGDGSFTDVSKKAGVRNDRYTKGVAWGDINNDGLPDLYVSTVQSANRLYVNNGDGTFTDRAEELGVTLPGLRSFATWFFDFDNDGWLDIFVGNYENSPEKVMASFFQPVPPPGQPLIYRNEQGKAFAEVSYSLGLHRPHLPMGANFGDLDNDGWLDFYLGTGEPAFEAQVPNAMYRNVAGTAFEDVSFTGGFAHIQKGHGVAFGDLDNDGDQDLFHQLGGFYPGDTFANALFENPGQAGNSVTLMLRGKKANYFGVGARIALDIVADGEVRQIHMLAGSGGSFGGSSMRQEIGVGTAELIKELRIAWPGSGTLQVFRDIPVNRAYEVSEQAETLREIRLPVLRLAGDAAQQHEH